MKIFKIIGVIAIMLFSFYYTEKISNYVLQKNQLYQDIDNIKEDYNVASVSAIIDNEYIIPGYNGQEVNVKESYFNMKSANVFNEYYLVFDEVIPKDTLEENKDKVIIKGNKMKNSVTFIIDNDEKIEDYFQSNNLKANILVTIDSFDKNSYFEQINNDVHNYDKLETLLNNNSLNRHLCIINENNEDICRDEEKFLIKPIELNNSNIINLKNSVESGNIYFIKKGTNLDNVKLLIKTVQYYDLNIIPLSEMISEKRD